MKRFIIFQILLSFLISFSLFAETAEQKKIKNFESPKCTINKNENDTEKNSTATAIAVSALKTPENFPTYLKLLANAQSVTRGPVGFAAACNKECDAYLKALKNGKSIKKELDWMLKNGTAAGKLYAAILIQDFDKKAGEQAFTLLQSEKTPVNYSPGGCEGGTTRPLGEHATKFLKNPNY